MSTAILKSPVFLDQRAAVTTAQPAGTIGSAAPQVDPMLALEARLRAELTQSMQADFDARWAEAREKAHAEGYQAGLVEGHEEGRASAQDGFRRKQALVEQVLEQVESEADAWRHAVRDQAFAAARQVLCELLGEQALSPSLLESIVKRVTSGLRDQDIVSVRVHPSEGRLLREACASRGDAVAASLLGQRLVDDAQLEAGGIVVDTVRGEYHATFETLLRKLLALVDRQRDEHASLDPVPHVRLA